MRDSNFIPSTLKKYFFSSLKLIYEVCINLSTCLKFLIRASLFSFLFFLRRNAHPAYKVSFLVSIMSLSIYSRYLPDFFTIRSQWSTTICYSFMINFLDIPNNSGVYIDTDYVIIKYASLRYQACMIEVNSHELLYMLS